MFTHVVIRGHSNLRQHMGTLTKFFVFVFLHINCGFYKTVECSCDTGLYKVINVRVWKLQC